ncbi:MAG: TatD family hydrolase [Actinomycetota bacterium]|nr:TatD family hydrolase [Actinomycetota bacterium]
MWFDSHCHLQIVEEDRDLSEILRAARLAGVHELYAAVGIHPNSAEGFTTSAMQEIARLAEDERVVGIGESGLDFYRDHASPELQARCFAAHIDLAVTTGKPLIIHTRDSVDACLATLEDRDVAPRLIFHCWSGGEEHLRRALALGAYISFAGNVSFKSADDLRVAARLAPADRLLIETDSPYLAPVPHRGKSNEPAYVADVGAAVALARGTPAEEVASCTTTNARAVFGVP